MNYSNDFQSVDMNSCLFPSAFNSSNTNNANATLSGAPSISSHELALNGRSLSDSAINDVFGTGPTLKAAVDENQISHANQLLNEVFGLLPHPEKEAYLEALATCPNLVESESSPQRYLRFDNYDAAAAALRIAKYWSLRKDVFKERAFLPMDQTGEGALSPDDLKLLTTGFGMILPEDKHGRVVFCHDRARLTSPEFLNPGTRLRCLFYLLQVASEQECTQSNGMVLMSVYGVKTRATSFDQRTLNQTISLFQSEVIPVRVKAFHLVMISKRPILEPVIPVTLQTLMEKWPFLHQRTVVHNRIPTSTLIPQLEKYGLHPDCLPKVPLDGEWTFGRFKGWRNDRLLHEKQLRVKTLPASKIDKVVEELKEEEETRKRRQVDAVYARRKRTRQRIELEVMQEQVDRLKNQQRQLQRNGDDLQEKLKKTKQIVEAFEKSGSIESEKSHVSFRKENQDRSPAHKPAPGSSLNKNDSLDEGRIAAISPSLSNDSNLNAVAPINYEQQQQNLLSRLYEENSRLIQQRKYELQDKIMRSIFNDPKTPNSQTFGQSSYETTTHAPAQTSFLQQNSASDDLQFLLDQFKRSGAL